MDNLTLHCQIFDTHPNDVGLQWIYFSNSTATMMLSTCMIVQAVLTFQVPLKWQLQTRCLALCRKSLLDTLNALYKEYK